jgi:hypothetical protein
MNNFVGRHELKGGIYGKQAMMSWVEMPALAQ